MQRPLKIGFVASILTDTLIVSVGYQPIISAKLISAHIVYDNVMLVRRREHMQQNSLKWMGWRVMCDWSLPPYQKWNCHEMALDIKAVSTPRNNWNGNVHN